MRSVRKKGSVNKDYWGYIFISPFIIVFLGFALYPIFNTFWMSLTDASLMNPGMRGDFIGLENFRSLLTHNMFHRAISNTWLLWLGNFIPQMLFALVLAVMFTSTTFRLRGTGFFKAIFYLPNLLMPATVAALFSSLLAFHGPLNQFLVGVLGIMPEARDWLAFPTYARGTVMFLQTWLWFGQTAIVLVAGMTSISPTYYESAMIDGAGQFKMFTRITLPLLKPVLLFVLVTSMVGGMQMFDIPMLLSGNLGAPDHSVLTINMFMNNRRAFPAAMIGSAAAVSVVLFFMSSFIALILFRIFRESSDEKAARKAKKAERKVLA